MDVGTISLVLLIGMPALLAIGMSLGFASGFLAAGSVDAVVGGCAPGAQRLRLDRGRNRLSWAGDTHLS
jgi:hypothetical protein